MRRAFATLFVWLLCVPLCALAADPAGDAPELAAAGPFGIGYATSKLHVSDSRILDLSLWYPTSPAPRSAHGQCYKRPTPALYVDPPKSLPATMGPCGKARPNAAPLKGRYPVLLLSHGFGNWGTAWSGLAERLAAKGYVVVAIDHADAVSPPGARSDTAVAQALATRSLDQQAAFAALRSGRDLPAGLAAISDTSAMALVGYSLGGFGALATAGAAYAPASPVAPVLPAALKQEPAVQPGLKALVLFAPWGGGQPWRAWSSEALARIKAPALFITGDEDDVADYRGGIRWLFDQMTGSDRLMLVFQNARHNVALDPAPPEVADFFLYREHYDEPVWRKDRMLDINVHLLTAFLALHLKGEARDAAVLEPPHPRAIDGQWPLASGERAEAAFASAKQPDYWRGFQRRWAVGLTLEHKPAQ